MKRMLSFVLALALCLSLTVPALAAGESGLAPSAAKTSVYENETVRITNMIDKGDLDTDYSGLTHVGLITRSCTVAAPSVITPGAKFGDGFVWFIAIYPENLPEDGDVSDLDWDTYDGYEGKSLTLDKPGAYSVGFSGAGHDANFCITVQGNAAGSTGTDEPGTGTSVTSPRFADVAKGVWYYEPVQWAVEQKITTGTSATAFSPLETCVNAQILTFLWRADGSPEPQGGVSSGEYYAKAVKWAAEQEIASEPLDPSAPCTRAMTVTYLWKAAGSPQSDADIRFTDVAAGTELARAVAWAVEQGVTTGTSATAFTPDKTCDRAEIVTFLYRAFVK